MANNLLDILFLAEPCNLIFKVLDDLARNLSVGPIRFILASESEVMVGVWLVNKAIHSLSGVHSELGRCSGLSILGLRSWRFMVLVFPRENSSFLP